MCCLLSKFFLFFLSLPSSAGSRIAIELRLLPRQSNYSRGPCCERIRSNSRCCRVVCVFKKALKTILTVLKRNKCLCSEWNLRFIQVSVNLTQSVDSAYLVAFAAQSGKFDQFEGVLRTIGNVTRSQQLCNVVNRSFLLLDVSLFLLFL